jgi:ATP-dependent NAD(P)H-hydrate dehydratase
MSGGGPGAAAAGGGCHAAGGGCHARFARAVPDLAGSSDLHKGSCGRLGVIGGSPDYTGAPYYAGISGLKFGADLAYVFAAQEAALTIKGYSPELMVTPVYQDALWGDVCVGGGNTSNNASNDPQTGAMVEKIAATFDKLHGLLIGPGLGRHPGVFSAVKDILALARSKGNMPIILDADALFLVASEPEIVQSFRTVVLTPNVREFNRLWQSVFSKKHHSDDARALEPDTSPDGVAHLANEMGNCTIVLKGAHDIISNGITTVVCRARGGNRRSGGQGDILAGCISVAVIWATRFGEVTSSNIDAACAACHVVKLAQCMAFNEKRRSMTAPDVIECIGPAFQQLFPSEAV